MLIAAWTTSIILIYLQLHSSNWIWQLLPFLRFLQFPWRLSLVLPVLSALMLGSMLATFSVQVQRGAVCVVMFYWLFVTSISPLEYLHNPNQYYDSFPLSTSTQNENKSQSFTFIEIGDNPRQPIIFEGSGEVSNVVWNGSSRSYQLNTFEQTTVVEPTMNFPGWETRSNQQKIAYVDSPEIGGRVAYVLPKGSYQITTRFTQRTPARRVGNMVSLIAVVWIIVREVTMRRKT